MVRGGAQQFVSYSFCISKDVKNSLFPLLNWKTGIIISAFPVHSIVMYSLC
jgi:hypothetical protein